MTELLDHFEEISVLNSEVQIRLFCLRLAQGCSNPDQSISADDVIRVAETFYRYVVDGKKPDKKLAVV